MKPKPQNKRANIYISDLAKKTLDDLKSKYHVSYSTIIDTLINQTWKNKKIYNDLKEKYLVKQHTKTSVRPQISIELRTLFTESEISKIYTNIVEIYANKKLLEKYLKEWILDINKFKTDLGNKLAKKREIYYNYNATVRNQARAIRENKEYWRKILEQ